MRIWQDRSGVTGEDNRDIRVEEGRESDIVVTDGGVSYIALMWWIGAGVRT